MVLAFSILLLSYQLEFCLEIYKILEIELINISSLKLTYLFKCSKGKKKRKKKFLKRHLRGNGQTQYYLKKNPVTFAVHFFGEIRLRFPTQNWTKYLILAS